MTFAVGAAQQLNMTVLEENEVPPERPRASRPSQQAATALAGRYAGIMPCGSMTYLRAAPLSKSR